MEPDGTDSGVINTYTKQDRPFFKRLFIRFLEKISVGKLILKDKDELLVFGEKDSELSCQITINKSDAYRRIIRGGGVGVGESYMLGDWDADDLTKVVRIFLINRAALEHLRASETPLKKIWLSLLHSLNRDTIKGSKKNIMSHYDLGNNFFEKFLDPTMSYSCANFKNLGDSLESASTNKIDNICMQLGLSASDHLLEIGTGWGGLAIHAAEQYGCRVTTTTISEEQFDYVESLISQRGLQNQVTLLKKDYRDLQGKYDKLVSVEMIEAVGLEFIPEFFKRCSSLLNSNGLMLVQAITMEEQRFQKAKNSVDFIQRYIFPGGALPTLTGLAVAATKNTDLRPLDVRDITLHYSETLKRWKKNFNENIQEIKDMGFDENFQRMWNYYLAYCEGAFFERAIGCVQMQFHKPFFRGEIN